MTIGKQFCLLFWKNGAVMLRQKICFGISIAVGIVILVILLLYRPGTVNEGPNKLHKQKQIDIEKLQPIRGNAVRALAYCPDNKILEDIVSSAAKNLELSSFPLASEALVQKNIVRNKGIAGIIFDKSFVNLNTTPKELSYKLRFPTVLFSSVFSESFTNWQTDQIHPTYVVRDNNNSHPAYISENFISIQHAIATSYIRIATNNGSDKIPKVKMERFPLPRFTRDTVWKGFEQFYALILLYFASPSAHIAMNIAAEKKKQFKVATYVMGVPNWIHWAAWLSWSIIYLGVFMLLLIIVLQVRWYEHAIINNTSTNLLILYFLAYINAVVTFSFMFGVFFSSAFIAYIMMVFWWALITLTTFTMVSFRYLKMTKSMLIPLSFYMNFAMGFGLKELCYLEVITDKLYIRDINHPSPFKAVTFQIAFIMLFVDAILYMLITLYLEQMKPAKSYCDKEFYFPILNLCRGCKQDPKTDDKSQNSIDGIQIENEKRVGIEAKNLSKVFSKKLTLEDINMQVYVGELTAVLAHHGGGKSATIALLSGITTPDKGTVTINGYDLKYDPNFARRRLGYCPPFDMLLDELTVEEQLNLVAKLKGAKGIKIREDILKYIRALDIQKYFYVRCSKLKLGIKKKLHICMALCGGSKFIICDEPAKNLDPTSRKLIWNLLQMEKTGKTILVFTCFQPDIDYFADRVGILIKGVLRGYGKLEYLRKKLGGGYKLICEKEEDCNTENLTNFLKKFVPKIFVDEETSKEIYYLITQKNDTELENILRQLNNSLADLKIKKFALRLQTVEELMMSSAGDTDDSKKTLHFPDLKLVNISRLPYRHWRAMIFKKLVYSTYKFKTFAGVVILLGSTVALMFYFIARYNYIPELLIDLKTFQKPAVYLEIAKGSQMSPIAYEYSQLLDDVHNKIITTNLYDYMLKKQKETPFEFMTQDVAAGTIKDDSIIAWFNYQIYHTIPLSLNLVHNAILKAKAGRTYSIKVTNAPLAPELYSSKTEAYNLSLIVSAFYAIGMAVITSLFVIQIVIEIKDGYMATQLNSGVTILTYWTTAIVWDLFVFLIIDAIMIFILAVVEMPSPYIMQLSMTFFLITFIFGFAAISMTYFFSIFFVNASNACAFLTAFNLVTGFGLFLIERYTNLLRWLFMIFPHFALATAVEKSITHFKFKDTCVLMCINSGICAEDRCSQRPDCCNDQSIYAFDKDNGIGLQLIYLITVGMLCLIILFLQKYGLFKRITISRHKEKVDEPNLEDSSILLERLRVMRLTEDDLEKFPVVLDRVTKHYSGNTAVNGVSVAIAAGEIFGIVGPNGCGKTTILKLLRGAEPLSVGDAYIMGTTVDEYETPTMNEIGYSSQQGGLVGFLTGRDALHICCLIRGITNKDIEHVYTKIARYLGIKRHLDLEIRHYNGSNKRKLSIAMAAIGNASLIYLDEPTFVCEPAAKRVIWNFIENLNKAGRTIILTSHNIFECCKLCTRFATMVNGQFVSIGTPEEHQNKVQNAIDLSIKFQADEVKTELVVGLKRLIERTYTDATLRVEYYGVIAYLIPLTNGAYWADIIQLLEQNKETYKIRSYSLSIADVGVMYSDLANKQRKVKVVYPRTY